MYVTEKTPNCYSCRNFGITWQEDFPYSCSAFSMKCRFLPSLEVKRRSGYDCLYFESKQASRIGEETKGNQSFEQLRKKANQSAKLKGDTGGIDFLV